MQHRQVEASAVPGDELWDIALDAVVKALDQLGFAAVGLAQRPYLQLVAATQHAGNGDDAVQVVRHEVAAGFLAPGQQCHFGELGLRQCRFVHAVECGEPGEVGNRFNIENQGGVHGDVCGQNRHFTLSVQGCVERRCGNQGIQIGHGNLVQRNLQQLRVCGQGVDIVVFASICQLQHGAFG